MRLGLQGRLLLSHVIVMGVGILTLVSVGKVYSPQLFVLHLERIENHGTVLGRLRYELVDGFQEAWSRGAIWSILIGGGTAGGLSYWVARRIVEPLRQIEQVTEAFARGQWSARLPQSNIPELGRLSHSFNQMAASLENVEQQRRELVGDLTHELRTPLTILLGYLEGMADGDIEPSAVIYGRLTRETQRLKRLIDDLQDLSKVEAGHLPIHPEPIDIYSLLTPLVAQFDEQLAGAAIVIRLDCESGLPLVRADRDRLQQVLINLLGNALRYTSKGEIIVRAWGQRTIPGFVWIAVRDTGGGIAAIDLPFVFDRFWRSEGARAADGSGSGVGLAIAQRLVEIQGGEIQVESELGQGSEFRFSLPTD
jgi:signal transduction histidine kinase